MDELCLQTGYPARLQSSFPVRQTERHAESILCRRDVESGLDGEITASECARDVARDGEAGGEPAEEHHPHRLGQARLHPPWHHRIQEQHNGEAPPFCKQASP